MFHRKIQPVISWNQSISSPEEERDSEDCGRLYTAEGGGGEEQVMLSQTHETQVTSDKTLYLRTQRIKGKVLQDTGQSWPNPTALIIIYIHTYTRGVFGWFLLFGINRWQCRLILLNCNVISKMCVFQKEVASAGEKTFVLSLKPIAVIELTRLRRKRFDFGDERAAAWRDPGEVAVKGKNLIILLKDVQASLLTRWLHLLFHQPKC